MQRTSFLIGDDITLRVLEQSDAEKLFQLINSDRPHLREWLPWVDANSTIRESQLFIRSTEDQRNENAGFQCGIWSGSELAGIIGFHRIDWVNRSVEIGYWLGSQFQGRGIMTKACLALIEYAFEEYKLNRVQLRCATGNHRSRAVIERLGFMYEGLLHQAEYLYNRYVDLFVYGMTDDMWKRRDHH
jgi:ribosomal-protein-serine acetyltransferase